MSRRVKLDQLKVGEGGEVVALVESGGIYLRLMEMGVLPGTQVKVLRRAPLGDPMEVEIRGYLLSLRKGEAEKIEVELGGE